MRTPKIEALYRLIDWLNARSKTTSLRHPSLENQQITKLGLDDSDLGDNPWLSGFIEADGNFYSAFDLNSEGVAGLVRHYMRISQKTTYGKSGSESTENNSNLGVMDKLKDFLDVKNVTSSLLRPTTNWSMTILVGAEDGWGQKLVWSKINQHSAPTKLHLNIIAWMSTKQIHIFAFLSALLPEHKANTYICFLSTTNIFVEGG